MRIRSSLLIAASIAASIAAASCTGGGADPSGATPVPPAEPTATPPAGCAPVTGGPFWLEEGETVSFTVTCSGSSPVAADQLSLEPLPEGATWDAATATFSWTPGLDQAAVWNLTVHVAASDERAPVKIGVADAYDAPGNVPVVDPLRYTEEYGLPVFFLSPKPTNTSEYEPVVVTHGGDVYGGAQGKRRGVTSIHYPKSNYTLKFTKEDKFQEPSQLFVNKRKIVLLGNFDDNSYLRPRLAFDVWNAMDPGHVQVNTYSAVVYTDGQYQGLYTVVDQIGGHFMEDQGFDQDGDMFKAITAEADFRLTLGTAMTPKHSPHQGYEKTEGFPEYGQPGAWAKMDDLVRFVAESDDGTFAAEVGSRLDMRDYQDWWVFVTLILANDSTAKNSYHYHSTPGPWRYIPWDFNASFGQNWKTTRMIPEDDISFEHRNLLFERMLATPGIKNAIDDRYGAVLAERVPKEMVLGWIDAYAAGIEPSARRDERKWSEAYRSWPNFSTRTDFNTWEGEVAYVRSWVDARWDYQGTRFPN